MRMEGNTMDLESIKGKEQKISKTRNNISTAYNDYKEFEGRKYTGMRVGGVHHWYYENGEWKEKKVAPDKWEFTYATNKRRAWNAPEGLRGSSWDRVLLVYSCSSERQKTRCKYLHNING